MTPPDERSGGPGLERRDARTGRKPGDRYVRIVRPAQREFRREGGHYVATRDAHRPSGALGRAFASVRRALFGRPLESEADATERLSVPTGLAILGSDNISSSAYATEEAMRILALAGAGALALTMPVAFAVVAILAVVVLSQLQVIRAYPNGGGSYVVTADNLGKMPGLFAGAALLIDYVLTVAVSTAAGVAAISSFVPELQGQRVAVGIAFIGILMLGNLRGIREAGLVFAGPTYFYLASIGALIVYGMVRVATGDVPTAALPPHPFPDEPMQALGLLLVLRAFSSGSVALTGSEAIANGVPSMRPPEARSASITLILMGVSFATIFLSLSFLAQAIGVRPDLHETETVNSLITRSLVGAGTPFYYAVQVGTALILALAANTGFTGFPRLASVLANDRFMPRHFAHRGERLAFSTGIIALAALAAAVLAAFGGSVTSLIPLYTIGVFLAFTLSQSGLVRRWWRLRPRGWRVTIVINAVGALVTGVVLVIVAVTKFEHGAWMVLVVLPVLVALLWSIERHYRTVHDALVLETLDEGLAEIAPPVVIVPVARIDRSARQALTFARSISPHVRVVHVATSPGSAREFQDRFARWAAGVPLDVIESPYRSLVPPLLRYIDALDRTDDRPITVVLAEYVPRTPWEWLLHSQTALRLKANLLFRPNTIVVDVPYHHAAQT
ncbi:MAG TPA: APC family permease [Candidatus Limnocylindria bacterium]|nr:APC family permease [Candidatus Limnocylindria bacterium]